MAPTGTVTVRDVFGRAIMVRNLNEGGGRVLPATTRTYEETFGLAPNGWLPTLVAQARVFAVGPMTATLDVASGNGQTLSSSFSFVFVPWLFLFVLLVAIAFILLVIQHIR